MNASQIRFGHAERMPKVSIEAVSAPRRLNGGGHVVDLLVSLHVPPAPRAHPSALNCIFVIDSGASMAGLALDAGCAIVRRVLRFLGPDDYVAVLAAGESPVLRTPVLRCTHPHEIDFDLISIAPNGAGDLHAAWREALGMVSAGLDNGAPSFVVLVSDGGGAIAPKRAAFIDEVATAAGKGVATFVLGVGENCDASLLRELGDAGGGWHAAGSRRAAAHWLFTQLGRSDSVGEGAVTIDVRTAEGVRCRALEPVQPIVDGMLGMGDVPAMETRLAWLRVLAPAAPQVGEGEELLSLRVRSGARVWPGSVALLGGALLQEVQAQTSLSKRAKGWLWQEALAWRLMHAAVGANRAGVMRLERFAMGRFDESGLLMSLSRHLNMRGAADRLCRRWEVTQDVSGA